MNRYLRILTLLLTLVCIIVASRWTLSLQEDASVQKNKKPAAVEIVSYASNRITGGIGIQFYVNPATGAPTVAGVLKGSPAQLAGILEGDIIAKINGISVTGIPIAQVTHKLTGLSFQSVRVTLNRKGSTNIECVIRRESWSRILGTNATP